MYVKKRLLFVVLLLVLPLVLATTNLDGFEDMPLSSLRLKDKALSDNNFDLALGVVWEEDCIDADCIDYNGDVVKDKKYYYVLPQNYQLDWIGRFEPDVISPDDYEKGDNHILEHISTFVESGWLGNTNTKDEEKFAKGCGIVLEEEDSTTVYITVAHGEVLGTYSV